MAFGEGSELYRGKQWLDSVTYDRVALFFFFFTFQVVETES